ncbi:MAB_1171c family putative transporter, partial [Kitasatospora nipponensis]|uniref:MAB_1171c family putative transporter n=1 Tax=Kitasatospora nipponensis TaxID=258049 RepID=UPI0031DF7EE4
MAELGATDLLAYLGATLFLTLAAQRWAAVRGEGADPVQRHVFGFALCMGGALAALAPATVRAAGGAGVGQSAALMLGDTLKTGAVSLLVLAALGLQARGVGPSSPRTRIRVRIRRHVLAAVLVPPVMVLLFSAAHGAVRGDELVVHGWGRWLLAAYDTLFAGYCVGCLAVLGAVLARQARRARPGPLRTGLRLMTCATAVGVLWSLWALDDITDILASGRQGGGEDEVSNLLGVLCAALTVGGAGFTLWGGTRWGARLTAPARWPRARRQYLALEPLWSALHTVVPQIALAGPEGGRRRPLRHAEFALYRRIIEIRDGQLALRPYVHGDVPAWLAQATRRAGGPVGTLPVGAIEEAALLAAALEGRRAGRRPGGGQPAPCVPQPVPGTVAAE